METAGVGGFDDLVLDGDRYRSPRAQGEDGGAAIAGVRPRVPRSPGPRIVYELHVKGFTQTHPDIPAEIRGTLAGLAHPAAIAHLVGLGVTTVELMPIAAWIDERHLPPARPCPTTGATTPSPSWRPTRAWRRAGWRRSPPPSRRCTRPGSRSSSTSSSTTPPRATSDGQTFSFRGLDNRTYYRLAEDPRFYVNDTGCGHTVALDRAPVVRLVMDTLRHWALRGGFDGFRFDLATVLGRRAGRLRSAGAPARGHRSGPGAARPRDDRRALGHRLRRLPPRRFSRPAGANGTTAFATMSGASGAATAASARWRRASPAPRTSSRRAIAGPASSVNFVSAHDGFTLADLVSYADRHNEANGEGNRDGHAGEVSWSNGAEGATADPAIKAARRPRHPRAPCDASALARHADDRHGRRDRPQPGRQQQRLLPKTTPTTWIDWSTADRDLTRLHKRADVAAACLPRSRAGPLSHRSARRRRRARRRLARAPRTGRWRMATGPRGARSAWISRSPEATASSSGSTARARAWRWCCPSPAGRRAGGSPCARTRQARPWPTRRSSRRSTRSTCRPQRCPARRGGRRGEAPRRRRRAGLPRPHRRHGRHRARMVGGVRPPHHRAGGYEARAPRRDGLSDRDHGAGPRQPCPAARWTAPAG